MLASMSRTSSNMASLYGNLISRTSSAGGGFLVHAGYFYSHALLISLALVFFSARSNTMSTCKSTACIALAAVITLIAGVSDAFVAAPSVSVSSKIDALGGSNTRAASGRSRCLSMGADGGTTRGEQRGRYGVYRIPAALSWARCCECTLGEWGNLC